MEFYLNPMRSLSESYENQFIFFLFIFDRINTWSKKIGKQNWQNQYMNFLLILTTSIKRTTFRQSPVLFLWMQPMKNGFTRYSPGSGNTKHTQLWSSKHTTLQQYRQNGQNYSNTITIAIVMAIARKRMGLNITFNTESNVSKGE